MKNTGYTYQIKRNGRDFCQLENKGLVSYQVFLSELDAHLWPPQTGDSVAGNEFTLAVKHLSTRAELFVSVVGSREDFAYMVGMVNAPPTLNQQTLNTSARRRVQVYLAEQQGEVRRLFSLFFDGEWSLMDEALGEFALFLEPQEERAEGALD
ncbi:hypothetical protein EXU34_15115 [Alteromonas sp. ZYF713]|nr:hypothetical protein [Alteromonas sp. ZYF713]